MLSNDISNKPYRFKIELKPDLSTASLHAIYNPGLTPQSAFEGFTLLEGYMICEDNLVSFWLYERNDDEAHCEVYTEPMSACFDNAISHSGPAVKMLLPDIGRESEYVAYPCPASGRFVRHCRDSNNRIAVLDFFWYIPISICRGHGGSDTNLREMQQDLTDFFFFFFFFRLMIVVVYSGKQDWPTWY